MRQDAGIIHFHVGRTGGTTLRHDVLLKMVQPHEAFLVGHRDVAWGRHGSVDELASLPAEVQNQLRLMTGHMSIDVRERLADPSRWHYVTMLREPIARCVSDYYQSYFQPKNPAHPYARSLPIDEFVRKGYGQNPNGTCRWLSGSATGKKFDSPRDEFEAAVAKAEQFAFVGILEYFEESVERLCATFGWKVPTVSRRNALTPRNHFLSPGERRALVEANQYDLMLYEMFRGQFERQRSLRAKFFSALGF